MEVKARMDWVIGQVGHTLMSLIVESWKYMDARKLLPDDFVLGDQYKKDQDAFEDNYIIFLLKVAGATTALTASMFVGDLAQTAGTWSPNNYVVVAIRLFLMSLAYGLGKHPGDDEPTSEEEVRGLLHNLSALTSCESFWVMIFCRGEDVHMVKTAMNESTKIRGSAEDCVSDVFLVLLSLFHIPVRITTEIYLDFSVFAFL
jgi:hypothetical protein